MTRDNVVPIRPLAADEIFAAVCRAPRPERRGLLAELCGGDAETQALLLAMLADFERDEDKGSLRAGEVIADRYELIKELGSGATASVWMADDRKMRRKVALKIFSTVSRPHWREVVEEARCVTDVESDHVVRVNDVSQEESDVLYIDMQLCREFKDSEEVLGVPLSLEKPRSVEEAVSWVEQAARGVQAAHVKGVFHRDIKPDNLLLERHLRRVKVGDFGLAVQRLSTRAETDPRPRTVARVTSTGLHVAGTPPYMAPEQARGFARPLDPKVPQDRIQLARIDVYGLGALLYELLAGVPPYEARDGVPDEAEDVIEQVTRSAPPPLRERATRFPVPARLERIVAHAMARDPKDRYASAEALAEDLARFRGHLASSQDQTHPFVKAGLWAWRNRLTVLTLLQLSVLLSLIGATTYFSRQAAEFSERAADSRKEAEAAARQRLEFVQQLEGAQQALARVQEARAQAEAAREEALRQRDAAVAGQARADQKRKDALGAKSEAEKAKEEADRQRQEALAAKALAEQERQVALTAKGEAEKEKAQAEKEKAQAEKEKAEADKQRDLAEKAKAQAEAQRDKALEAKGDAEKAKAEADKQRDLAEKARAEAEKAKLQAEAQRDKATEAKTEADRLRELAEKAKTTAEGERKKALTAKKQADTERDAALAELAKLKKAAAEPARNESGTPQPEAAGKGAASGG